MKNVSNTTTSLLEATMNARSTPSVNTAQLPLILGATGKDTDQVRLMTPVQFLARLAALVPPPRHPLRP